MATKRSVGTLSEADLKGKKVFLRADLNVPLDDSQKITDDTRIRASVPTIKFLMEKGAKVILASHLVSSGFFDFCILTPKGLLLADSCSRVRDSMFLLGDWVYYSIADILGPCLDR